MQPKIANILFFIKPNALNGIYVIIIHTFISIPLQFVVSLPPVIFISRCKLTDFAACIGEQAALAALASVSTSGIHGTSLEISLAQPLSLDLLQDKFGGLC